MIISKHGCLRFGWLTIFVLLIFNVTNGVAQKKLASRKAPQQSQIFQISDPDYRLSPFTGMTRKHWRDAARYLLSGAFSYVKKLDDPMKFPKQEGKSYPRNSGQVPTEMLEGLCRTLLMAAPLLREDSALTLHGIKVADYYRHQLSNLINPASPMFVRPRAVNGGPHQNLVEFGALSMCLFVAPEVLWQPLPAHTKAELAKLMLSYGDGPTISSNWKFFNIFILSFFKQQGYAVNDKLLVEYLEKALGHYRGNGWYNDNPAFDYYSMWAFQLYGPLWSKFFGNVHYPQFAARFQENFKELKNSYPFLFGRSGEMIMWGRSMSYRFGSVAPFPLMGFETDDSINYGWMRRIASGTILQFLKNPALLRDSIPTLGFYGAFEPAVQPYSCRGSVYWMGKAFLGLLVPAESPFWTAQENEGTWNGIIKKDQVHNTFLDSSKILITNYAQIGASEVRAWCHVKAVNAREPFRSSENYNRLAYNSAFPWQADSVKGVVAMNYLFKPDSSEWEAFRLYDFKGYHDGVYYRDAVLETNAKIRFHLADIPLANGILRVDYNYSNANATVKLGHYALPQLDRPIQVKHSKINGHDVEIIDNGHYQLAMITLRGWKTLATYHTLGVHPQAYKSAVINATDSFQASIEHPLYISLMLWKKSGMPWSASDLTPVSDIQVKLGGKIVTFKVGGKAYKTVDFSKL